MKLRIAIFIIFSFGLFNTNLIKGEISQIPSDGEETLESKSLKNIGTNYLTNFVTNPYIIGPGDKIEISVSPDYPELLRTVTINGEGTINLPILKKVYIEGLTLEELDLLLNEKFSKYVKFPEVESTILFYRPVSIVIDGEVPNPGLYKLSGSLSAPLVLDSFNQFRDVRELEVEMESRRPYMDPPEIISFYFPTVFDALKASGGVTRFSDLSNIKLIRENTISDGGGKIQTTLNFENLVLDGDRSQNIRIYDGDMIVISKLKDESANPVNIAIKTNLNPKYIRVFVSGRVNSPGRKTIGKESSLNDAIDMAGGVKVLKGPIKYLTFNNNGGPEKSIFSYRKNSKRGSKTNPYLKEGDLIMVGSSILSDSAEVINEVTAPFRGIYSTYKLIEAFTD